MAERKKNDPQLHYRPGREKEWRTARPYGIDYKEDYSRPKTHDMKVCLDGGATDMIKSQENWSDECVETEGGKEVALTYSDGSVKENGTIGPGAWHVKGCSLSSSVSTHSSLQFPWDLVMSAAPPSRRTFMSCVFGLE